VRKKTLFSPLSHLFPDSSPLSFLITEQVTKMKTFLEELAKLAAVLERNGVFKVLRQSSRVPRPLEKSPLNFAGSFASGNEREVRMCVSARVQRGKATCSTYLRYLRIAPPRNGSAREPVILTYSLSRRWLGTGELQRLG